MVVLDALLKQELDALLKPWVSHCSSGTYSTNNVPWSFPTRALCICRRSHQRKGEREGKKAKKKQKKKRRQHSPDWRLAAEIGELLKSVVEDVALLLKSHGNRVFVRVA